ncbi:VanZ family protein [Ornithinimicrobium cryptoxanthini]|uniref:VanZ family protein n=1 Tax=Ornithinimicrobium cryptoxanthini TaxID=2934161 RepID=A0ABY4YGF8_9MICO|nr:VanZ family protein [Ornithinimicrobium cryptoxanthini]USQ75237.1 VanZ family protein [Ornithinimicrobium cryptoxanthini]
MHPRWWRGLLWAVLLILFLAQVWILYAVTPGEGEPFVSGQDKIGHLLLFGIPFAVALVLRSRPAALGILAHAVVSEPLQGLLTTTRTVDVWDLVADLVGIGLAAVGVWWVRRRRARHSAEAPAAEMLVP